MTLYGIVKFNSCKSVSLCALGNKVAKCKGFTIF